MSLNDSVCVCGGVGTGSVMAGLQEAAGPSSSPVGAAVPQSEHR